ncbi:hypothetical protein [Streptomyces sudanensis]|uniref:hypothetical protein n=1 Tax=Streptomyces sudanensis TaxID=436397 RepID=UPI0020CCB988|nr:hypothetical protein [Streptomyces sudanensis]MCP9956663.1 hypothetical protein [Streptomyces sudanensis]
MRPHAVPPPALLPALLPLLLLPGCSAPAAPPPPAPSAPAALAEPPPPPGPEAVALKLPFDAYEQWLPERYAVEAAEELLTRECMRRAGLDWRVVPPPPAEALDPPHRTRYGLVEAEVARRYGYHLPPEAPALREFRAARTARDEALSPHEARTAYGADGEGGCARQSYERLWSGGPKPDHDAYHEIAARLFERSRSDPRLLRAVAAWRACMRAGGYGYAHPSKAAGDPAWKGSPVPSPEEIATARADVACQRRSGYATTWASVETGLQKRAIAADSGVLREFAAANRRNVEAARRVLAGKRP